MTFYKSSEDLRSDFEGRTRRALHPLSEMVFLSLPSLSPTSRSSTSKWRASLCANISLVCPFLGVFKRTLQYSFRQIVSVALLGNRLWTWTLPPPPPQRTATGSPSGPTLHLRTSTLSAASTSPLSPMKFKFVSNRCRQVG